MTDFTELCSRRRSIRKYKETPVPEELLMKILEAGRLAPSSRNRQNRFFVLITDKEEMRELMPACNNQELLEHAPAAIVVCAKNKSLMPNGQPTTTVDASIATSYITLAAADLGLGSCWLANFNAEAVAKLIDAPEGTEVVAVTPIGYADEEGKEKDRFPMEEVVFRNKIG